jgi:hypothetical protein
VSVDRPVAEASVFAGDLVAAQEVVADRVSGAGAVAATGGLGGLVGVDAVGIGMPDVDGDAVERLAVAA